MTGESVLELLGRLRGAGVEAWIDGGWGVDALAGEQTRPHDDLDLVVRLSDAAAIREALAPLGFAEVENELPTRFVLADAVERRIDLHTVEFDESGGGVQTHQDGSAFRYPPEGFTEGGILGRPVPCISAKIQLACHLGYEPDEKDLHDVHLLHARFGLPLPVPYDTTPPKPIAPDLRRQREEVVRRHMESENVHDFDSTIDTFGHPRYELIATDRIHDGEAAVRDYFHETRTAFPDQRNELISLRHADDAVITEFWLLGTHEGPLLGTEPTGKPFRCRMTAFFLFDGADLVCERVYFDSATILRQLTS